MYQRRRLQDMVAPLGGEQVRGQPPQFAIQQVEQLPLGFCFAAVDLLQEQLGVGSISLHLMLGYVRAEAPVTNGLVRI